MTHRNEFPAEYSLTGCSPAVPVSASSAALILNQKSPVRQQFSANDNCFLSVLSHFAAQCTPPLTEEFVRVSQITNDAQWIPLSDAKPISAFSVAPILPQSRIPEAKRVSRDLSH